MDKFIPEPITDAEWRALKKLSRDPNSDKISSEIRLAACHDRPDDPRGLVRHRDGGDPCGLSRQQIGQARIYLPGIVPCTAHKRRHTDDEQLAQVFVAHLADTTEPFFATARLLKWRQSQPGSELPPRAELMRIANRCRKSRRADRPDAGNGHEAPCDIVAT